MEQHEIQDKKVTSLTSRRIRKINDQFRRSFSRHYGTVVCTNGVMSLPDDERIAVISKVQNFADFNEDNDPYSEHDFGAFYHAGQKYFFKIDYYDLTMCYRSNDPSRVEKTVRVLTIMFADEY